MSNVPPTRGFAVDLIVFYHHSFWGLEEGANLAAFADSDPRAFWDKILQALGESGVDGLEITFPPGDWRTALAAYGSVDGFLDALALRGQRVATGFFADVTFHQGDPTEPEVAQRLIAAAGEYAELLRRCDCDIMVAGVPMRRPRAERPTFFVDHAYAARLADLFNRIGSETREHGVELALHTGANSVMANSRDVDLMMLLTDAEYVSLCPDAGHLVLAGADPVKVLERHGDRVAIAHWKDAIGPTPRDMEIDSTVFARQREYFRRVGAGRIDWFAWQRVLERLPPKPWTVLEIDAAVDPVAELIGAREYIQTALERPDA